MKTAVNNNKKNIIYGVVALIVIVLILVGAYFLLRYFIKALVTYTPEIKTVIIAGFLTLFGTIFSIIYTKYKERKLQIEQEHRRQTAEIYMEYIGFLFSLINQEKLGKRISEKEIMVFMIGFYKKLIVWGSDEVIKEFEFQKSLVDKGGMEMVLGLGRMLLMIRKDLGHKNKGLSAVDLLSVFVKDLDKRIVSTK